MNSKFKRWFLEIKKNKIRIIVSLFFLVLAVVLFSFSADYLTDHKGYVVASDIILDNFGPYNLSFIYIWLFIAVVILFFLYPFVKRPKDLHYVIGMFSFFVIVRSFFVLFTHLGLPLDAIDVSFPGILRVFNSTNDLFFSGHAGLPFLGFLIFKENKKMKYFMLASSIILGITVLLMHEHYSIDVFSAFFITYGIYEIGRRVVLRNLF